MLRGKLDDLWEKYEEEKDLVMLVTKSEVEQAKNEEISVLKERVEALKLENVSLTGKLYQIGSLQDENRAYVADRTNVLADVDLFQSKCERLELENGRLKMELEKSQADQMQELKGKYDAMRRKYKEMASSSSEMNANLNSDQRGKQGLVDELGGGLIGATFDKTNNQSQPILGPNTKLTLDNRMARHTDGSEKQDLGGQDAQSVTFKGLNLSGLARMQQEQAQGSSNNNHRISVDEVQGTYSIKYSNEAMHEAQSDFRPKTSIKASGDINKAEPQHRSSSNVGRRENSKTKAPQPGHAAGGTSKKEDEISGELWRLRCKLLAEKYFNIIRDMKKSLKKLKARNKQEIEEMRQQMSNHVLNQLRTHISKLEQNGQQSSSRHGSQAVPLSQLADGSERKTHSRHSRKNQSQRSR